MAVRPLAFGVRLRQLGRSVSLRQNQQHAGRWVVEDSRPRRKQRRREHATLAGALHDLAQAWRERLH